jgi:hypothetical protein
MRRHPKWFRFFQVTCISAFALLLGSIIGGALSFGLPISTSELSVNNGMYPMIKMVNDIYYVFNKYDSVNTFFTWFEFIIGVITGMK